MTSHGVALPSRLVWGIVGLSALPSVLHLAGISFAASDSARGVKVHTILEWTAFCVALVSVHFSFVHFTLRRDVTTPIIGLALFFSGTMDAFHALAADGLIYHVADRADFIPFTWAISRIMNATLLTGGAALFLGRPHRGLVRTQGRGVPFVLLVGVMFGLLALAIIQVCATVPRLPRAIYPESAVPRPFDAIPLVIFLAAGGIVFPRFHRVHPSLFSHGLLVSLVPHLAAQCHAAFGSTSVFDSHANIASLLKILAYQVPLSGLMLDYRRAYGAEASLRAAQEKLQTARAVQQGLLPRNSPPLPGFDVAGVSLPADVMGGDYFDYVPMRGGKWGIVVGDVSGHDVGCSALLAQTRAYLRALVRAEDDPGALLTEANRFVAADVHESRFVTLFLARLDPAARTLDYAAAGHNAHLLDGADASHELPPTGTALGMIPGAKVACGASTPIPPGAVLLIVTDGITEAESLGGVPFGLDRLLNVVRASRALPSREIVERIQAAVKAHTENAPQGDDLTAVVVKSL